MSDKFEAMHMSGSLGCNFSDLNGFCYRHEGSLRCDGTDTCPDWAQVYAVKELNATLKAICKEMPWAGKGE